MVLYYDYTQQWIVMLWFYLGLICGVVKVLVWFPLQ